MNKKQYQERLLANETWPEKVLWSRLKRKQTGYSFQRQAIVHGYIVDFWCPATKVVVELDGKVHDQPEQAANDAQKDSFLTKSGIDVLRFRNTDVYKGMSAVLIRIWDRCHAKKPEPLKPFVRATLNSRQVESVEIKALRAHQSREQSATMQAERARNFRERYRNKKRKSCENDRWKEITRDWRERQLKKCEGLPSSQFAALLQFRGTGSYLGPSLLTKCVVLVRPKGVTQALAMSLRKKGLLEHYLGNQWYLTDKGTQIVEKVKKSA